MKKTITLLKTVLLLAMFYIPSASIQAQFECTDLLYVSLDANGEYTLFPEDLLVEGDLTGYTTSLSQSALSCADLGSNSITLDIFENSTLVFSCTTNVIVEDKVNPVIICTTGLNVVLDAQGVHQLTYDEIDNGSTDACGNLTYYVTPAALTCESPNPSTVTLTIWDGSGNSNQCAVNVSWDPYPNPTPSLVCNAQVTVTLSYGEEATITPDLILEGGPYGCPEQYEVEVSENNIPRPEPIVTLADTNKVLIVTITDLNTGNSCWGELIVVLAPGCDPVFEICDTECRTTPLGDCNSGHTADDNVEWPCDITIIGECESLGLAFTPEYLVAEGLAEAGDAFPEIIDEACYLLGTAYDDQVFFSPGMTHIERSWAIIYWNTGQIWEYTQNIFVMHTGILICDTLPWNTPLGDCASGHTDTDVVEWPADITVNTNCIYPEDLAMNPEVNAFDAAPTLYTDCNSLSSSYTDLVTLIDETTYTVQRTWEILEFNTNQIWSYVQTITVHSDTETSTVCVMREGGEPIPGVELIPGVITDETGCHVFENPEGIIVTPVKDSPLAAGVTLLDQILLMEYVLGISTLSPYQMIAADLSENGILSTLDVVYLSKIIDGTFIPTFEHNWKFIDRATQLPSVDISNTFYAYKFIGVKMGDIDNSYALSAPLPLQEIVLNINDEILNKKEEYQIPVFLAENKRILGFSAKIRNEGINIDFLNVTSVLPGFDFEKHVAITPGLVTINYIVPQELLESGVAIPAGSALFNLQLEPKENAILSESLTLENSHENILKPSHDEALALTFGWQNVIISSVLNPGQTHKLQFYPNPASDKIHFQGFESAARGTVSVIDATGRVYTSANLAETMDISAIQQGMYYLSVTLESGETYTAPLLKIRS